MGIDCDHTHLHMVIPQEYSVSKVGETIKTNTSKLPREKFGLLDKLYKVDQDNKEIWGKGYLVSTVGINEQIIRNYVEFREKEDTGQTEFEL